MKLIVVVDKNWGIGKKNDLLFHLPLDMKRFQEITTGKTVVMGGNTLLSFPNKKPLKNRVNIVLSDVFTRDDCTVFDTLDKLLKALSTLDTAQLFIIGGAMFYKTMLPYCTEALITKVKEDGDAEVFFENLDQNKNWQLKDTSAEVFDNGHTIVFATYQNLSPIALPSK